METIIRPPLPKRNFEHSKFYFVKNNDNSEEYVAYCSTTYRVSLLGVNDIVMLFAKNSECVLWTSLEAFHENYDIIGPVNRITFE
jgi:hypothetical protein